MQNETALTLLLAKAGANSRAIALVVTLAFALLARFLKGVTNSGAAAGGVICFIFYATLGPEAFAILVLVFVLTWLATRFGYQRKAALGTAERRSGRKASQVLANLGVAALCAGLYWRYGNGAFVVAFCSALAEAAADTISSEVGKASGQAPRLITTGRKVTVGTNGGITVQGTLAGIVSACVVSGASVLAGFLNWEGFLLCAGAAAFGMILDSLLGATLEEQGVLNNDAVNFLSTLAAAGVAFSLSPIV
jgi:uncharacterized protein (TIGR00297 family)